MSSTRHQFNWKIYLIFMLGVVPLSLMGVHQLIVKSWIPWSTTSRWVYLFYDHPNLFSMYFSNFVHVPNDHGVHLFSNVLTWVFVIAIIAFVYLFVAPTAKYRVSERIDPVSTSTLWRCTLVYFIAVPFIVSGVSIVAAHTFDPDAVVGYGFSGIIFAFGGYLAYLCRDLSIKKVTAIRRMRAGDKFMAFMIPMFFIIAIAADAITLPGTNLAGHLSGFLVGYLSPYIFEKISIKPSPYYEDEEYEESKY